MLTRPNDKVPLQALVWTLRSISWTSKERLFLVQDGVVFGDTSC